MCNRATAQQSRYRGHEHLRGCWLAHDHACAAGAVKIAEATMQYERDIPFLEALAKRRAVSISQRMVEDGG